VGTAHLQVLPTTVQGILAARIDGLSPEGKTLLQQLAVIGREFPLSLLRQVIAQPEDELYRLLASLQRKEFLYEQPAFPEVEYRFKHALTQEVAYNSVLQERRKALHERTAQAIETLFHSKLEDHYSRSSNTLKAIEYLQRKCQNSEGSLALNFFLRCRREGKRKVRGGGSYVVSALWGRYNHGTIGTHGARVSEVSLPSLPATLQ
jgi:predicted ATPase